MTTTEKIIAGGGILLLLTYLLEKTGSLVSSAANAINPLNPNNVFAQGSNSLASYLTGTNTTLGGAIYSASHDWYQNSTGQLEQPDFFETLEVMQLLHPTWRVLANDNINNPLWSPPLGSSLYMKWVQDGYPMTSQYVSATGNS